MKNKLFAVGILITLASSLALGATAEVKPEVKNTAAPKTVGELYPGLSMGPLMAAKLVTMPLGVLVQAGSIKVTQKEMDREIASATAEVQGQLKSNSFYLVENKVVTQLVSAEAKSWGKKTGRKPGEPEKDLISAYFNDLTKDVSVSDDECKALYEQNKDAVGKATYDQIKDQIKDYILKAKKQAVVDNAIMSMWTKVKIEVDKTWAAKQYAAAMNNPIEKARKSGKPSFVEFGAEWCPPCKQMAPIVESIKKEYDGKLNVVFVDVDKEQILTEKYSIGDSIPVQIFYDKDGKEVFRHVGLFPEDQLRAKLAEIGVK